MPHSVSVIDDEPDLAYANRGSQMEPLAGRLYRLVEPIHMVTYMSEEPDDALMALGHTPHWSPASSTSSSRTSSPSRQRWTLPAPAKSRHTQGDHHDRYLHLRRLFQP